MFARTTSRRASADTVTAASFYTIVETIKVGGRLRKSSLRKKKKSEASPGRASVSMALDPNEESDEEKKLFQKKMSDLPAQYAVGPFLMRGDHYKARLWCPHAYTSARVPIYVVTISVKHQFKKSSRCYNCKKQTNGIFNAATKLRKQCAENTNAVFDTSTKDNHNLRQNLN
ncbi:hypothetical protein PsorP6_016324 [Peronosclerospora sorghi]|uniref:Uncharacterized protein n=1 Tax=Peronosclerospora sorghi TaxID=230839 RepID=A0ACC0VN11_9STRA|nr:hypothetical protein PsorP6_016324 [Peronosclerospora sorghi]